MLPQYLTPTHQDFQEKNLAAPFTSQSSFFIIRIIHYHISLSKAILKLLTKETKETLKLKCFKCHQLFKHNFLSSADLGVRFLLLSPTPMLQLVITLLLTHTQKPLKNLIQVLCSISSLPDFCAHDGPARL